MPGSHNDINILDQTHLLDEISQGLSPKVNFVLNNKLYDAGYYLTDGIYPPWSIFMDTVSNPISPKEKLYSKLQEGKRKEVERGFGVLQARFRILALPCKLWNKDAMAVIIQACVILHNMIIEDEFEYKDLNQDYLFENGDGTRFKVDNLIHDEECISFSKILKNRVKMKDREKHFEMKNDLIEHLYNKFT